MIIRKSLHKPDTDTPGRCKCGGEIVHLEGKCRYPVGHYDTVIVPGGEGCEVAGYPFAVGRIHTVWISVASEIWYDMWGETIPSKSEFCSVVRDVSYDRLLKPDLAYYNRMSEKAKDAIVIDVMWKRRKLMKMYDVVEVTMRGNTNLKADQFMGIVLENNTTQNEDPDRRGYAMILKISAEPRVLLVGGMNRIEPTTFRLALINNGGYASELTDVAQWKFPKED